MVNFHELNPKIYLSGAIVIGFFQIIDGVSALNGYTGSLSQAFSLLEVFWFVVTMLFFIAFKKQHFNLLVPKLFLAYTFYGLIVGGYLLSGNAEVLPVWYMLFATLFGLIYLVSSTFVYRQHS